MAASSICQKNGFRARSNSLPSRPHPLVSQFDEQMCRLRDSQPTSTSSSSSVGHKLTGLQDLYDCVSKLLQLPLTQQNLVQEFHKKFVDKLLDGSLRLLDMCNSAKDALLQTRECIHELQSVIRRRQGDNLESGIRRYIASRKVVKKTIKKALKNMTNKYTSCSIKDDKEIVTMIIMLRELEAINLTMFESLLSFISEPRSESKPRGWSLVSKLVHQKRVACDQEEETRKNEFAMVDAALESFIGCKTSKSDNILGLENMQKKLNSLDLRFQDLADGTECLFRLMIRTRASLLNIFN